MATQYTDILKLALPVQGELSGTWGDVVNDNITSMIEEAIAGRKVINSWVANSHTLTTADGTTSESRAAILSLTDTGTSLTGAGTVICPAQSKVYIVNNGTGQDITFKTASGTGVTIDSGNGNMIVLCDGTNVVEAVQNIAGTLSVGSNLDVLSGDVTISSSGGINPLTVRRSNNDDGVVARYRKGVSSKGIFRIDSDLFNIYGPSQSGILFDTNAIVPVNTSGSGAGSDNTTNLGKSAARWKDLYLSGGLYVGGTGAANKLDDYEEGTWTPVFADATSGGNTGTLTVDKATYTKIGNIVNLELGVVFTSTSGMTTVNQAVIRGLPFTAKDTTSFSGTVGSAAYGAITNPSAGAGGHQPFIADNTAVMTFRSSISGGTGQPELMTIADINGGTGNPYIYCNITYSVA